MHDRIVIVENTRVQFLPRASYKVIKLCLSTLNDDSMVGHHYSAVYAKSMELQQEPLMIRIRIGIRIF